MFCSMIQQKVDWKQWACMRSSAPVDLDFPTLPLLSILYIFRLWPWLNHFEISRVWSFQPLKSSFQAARLELSILFDPQLILALNFTEIRSSWHCYPVFLCERLVCRACLLWWQHALSHAASNYRGTSSKPGHAVYSDPVGQHRPLFHVLHVSSQFLVDGLLMPNPSPGDFEIHWENSPVPCKTITSDLRLVKPIRAQLATFVASLNIGKAPGSTRHTVGCCIPVKSGTKVDVTWCSAHPLCLFGSNLI